MDFLVSTGGRVGDELGRGVAEREGRDFAALEETAGRVLSENQIDRKVRK